MTLINLITGIVVVGATLVYARRGAYHAAATFFIALIASLATVNYYELLEYLFTWVFRPMAPYADALGFLLTFLIVFLLLQYLAVTFLEEHTEMNVVANSIAGGIFGAMTALMLSGVLVISWLMLPGSCYFLSTEEPPKILFSSDELFLTTTRFLANDRIKGQVPFDPSHSFMKNRTNKFRPAGSLAATGRTPGKRGKGPGLAEDVNLNRNNAQDE